MVKKGSQKIKILKGVLIENPKLQPYISTESTERFLEDRIPSSSTREEYTYYREWKLLGNFYVETI